MQTSFTKLILTATIGAMFALSSNAMAMQAAPAPAAKTPAPKAKTMAPAMAAPSASEIADAKAKGMVWVNLGTKVYHKDGEFYGNTKKGKFMTEADAQKAGYRAAKMEGAKKAPKAKKSS